MKKLLFLLTFFIFSCEYSSNKSYILDDSSSNELTFIFELKTKTSTIDDIKSFTKYISELTSKSQLQTRFGYYISEDYSKVTLIEVYKNSSDAIKAASDFINGNDVTDFINLFEIQSMIVIGNASKEYRKFAEENGFNVEYRESIGGFVKK